MKYFWLLVLFLGGCTGLQPQPYEWYKASIPLPYQWVVLTADNLQFVCRGKLDKSIYSGCVRRSLPEHICRIYAELPEDQEPKWIVEHERDEHCLKGLDHNA